MCSLDSRLVNDECEGIREELVLVSSRYPGIYLLLQYRRCIVHCFLLLSVGLPVANAPDVLLPCGLLYYP